MEPLNFAIRIVTPAFIAGANETEKNLQWTKKDGNPPQDTQHNEIVKYRRIGPEGDGLRIPSLRGSLRFWFRAKETLADIGTLTRKECLIFGGTKVGQGLRIIPLEAKPRNWKPESVPSDDEFIPAGSARSYLGYGPLNFLGKSGVTSHNNILCRDAIPPAVEFVFKAFGNETQIIELKKCLILLHLFGGLGARSRRAWGSIMVNGTFIPFFDKKETITQYYARAIKELRWDENERPDKIEIMPRYSRFWRESKMAISAESHSSYLSAMDELYTIFKSIRNYLDPLSIGKLDHDLEYEDCNNKALSKIPMRLSFGLPFQAGKKNWNIEYLGYYLDPDNPEKERTIDRRASPLLLKIIEPYPGKFYNVALFFNSTFFGKENTKFGAKGFSQRFDDINYDVITEHFLKNKKWKLINWPWEN